jgi:hypothetical protein
MRAHPGMARPIVTMEIPHSLPQWELRQASSPIKVLRAIDHAHLQYVGFAEILGIAHKGIRRDPNLVRRCLSSFFESFEFTQETSY